jgi:hypothetical protein
MTIITILMNVTNVTFTDQSKGKSYKGKAISVTGRRGS